MAVVPLSSLLPIKEPPALGTDRNNVRLLWDVVTAVAGIIRAFFSGRLVEFHIDEAIDSTGDIRIPHNLRRRPVGLIVFRNDGFESPSTNLEAATETYVAPTVSLGNTARIAFILFNFALVVLP